MIQPANDVLLEKVYSVKGGNFLKAGEVSSKIKKVLKEIGIPDEKIRRLSIASFEAEMNVVCYAKIGIMLLSINHHKIKLTVEDVGNGIEDIALAMQEGYSTATEEIREMGFGAGMGLPNIKKNVDDFHIESTAGKGTRLEISITLKNLM
jgi:anti-sigma regulatory factor (Ser/Thr protein kinase)